MIEVEINEAKLRALVASLGLSGPVRVTLVRDRGGKTRGTASPGGSITITYGLESQAVDRLQFVQSQIVRTLLHEVRHVWQFENWSSAEWERDGLHSYQIKPSEKDARDFADRELANWRGLVRVRRTTRNRLGKLAAAERSVRQ